MEDLYDLIFDPNTGELSVDPSMSFEKMEDMILNDNEDSEEIEDTSFGHMKPISRFENLEDCIMQDGKSIKVNEAEVQ